MISSASIDDLARKGAERGIDLRPGLELVEQRLRTTVSAELPFAEQASRYLIDAGGKRFRPMLVLLCGAAGGFDPAHDDLVDAGVVVELVHLSTLYHDDVIDAADLRRGRSAAHVKWSNTVAILTGDFLLARASELSAALGVEVTRIMARTIADLCQGQIREVQGSGLAHDHGLHSVEPDREHYLTVVGEKTASLIASSCRLGALLAGMGPDAVEALTDYGWRLGTSFQLADDIIDITADPAASGKEPGTDLREGVRTLPVLLALEADGGGSELASLVAVPSAGNVESAVKILREHEAMDLARDAAHLQALQARKALGRLTDLPAAAHDALVHLTEYAVDRIG